MQYVAEAWTWIKAAEPAWVSAAAAVIGAAVALGFVIRWCVLRRDLRGSGAAIIALLGESCREALPDAKGYDRAGWIEHSSEIVYFKVGADVYLLCKRDLERMCCNFQKEAGERWVGSSRRCLMQPPRTAC